MQSRNGASLHPKTQRLRPGRARWCLGRVLFNPPTNYPGANSANSARLTHALCEPLLCRKATISLTATGGNPNANTYLRPHRNAALDAGLRLRRGGRVDGAGRRRRPGAHRGARDRRRRELLRHRGAVWRRAIGNQSRPRVAKAEAGGRRRRHQGPGATGEAGRIADAITTSLEGSLARLRLDRVDILHLHNPITEAGGGSSLSVRRCSTTSCRRSNGCARRARSASAGFRRSATRRRCIG